MRICFLMIFAVFGFFQNQCAKGETTNVNKTAAANTANAAMNKTMTNQTKNADKFDRLPDGVKSSDEVRKDVLNEKGEVVSYKAITVAEILNELGAKYEGDKLVDRDGKEIKFYTPPVRGASQGFEEDAKQQARDAQEFADLQKKYTVIVLYIDLRKVS